MRRHRAIALGLSLGSLALAAATWGSCEEESARAPPWARSARPARTLRAPWPGRWSSSSWLASGDAATGVEHGSYEDAGEPEPARADLVEALCDPLATSLCAARARCGCESTLGCFHAELARCESWLRCAYPPDERELAIDADRVAACVASLTAEHAHCVAPPPVEDCYAVLVDPATPGEPCGDEYASECVGGRCVDGTCVRTPRLGERCEDTCADSMCEAGRCRSVTGFECEVAADCGSGLACVEGRCGAPRLEGQWCEDDEACAPRLACDHGRCAHVERCALHRACRLGDECSGAHAYRCVPARDDPLSRGGDACEWGGCEEGLACREGRCEHAPGAGEPCPERSCAGGLACEIGLCVPRDLSEGAACTSYADRCAPGLACHYGDEGPRCRRAHGYMEHCEEGPCAYGLVCEPVFEDGRCVPQLCDASLGDPWSCDVD